MVSFCCSFLLLYLYGLFLPNDFSCPSSIILASVLGEAFLKCLVTLGCQLGVKRAHRKQSGTLARGQLVAQWPSSEARPFHANPQGESLRCGCQHLGAKCVLSLLSTDFPSVTLLSVQCFPHPQPGRFSPSGPLQRIYAK